MTAVGKKRKTMKVWRQAISEHSICRETHRLQFDTDEPTGIENPH